MADVKERHVTNNMEDIKDYLNDSTPQDWDVMLYNDNVTPFEFVVFILAEVFDMSAQESFAITMAAQLFGKAPIVKGLPDEATASAYVADCDRLKEELRCPELQITAEPTE